MSRQRIHRFTVAGIVAGLLAFALGIGAAMADTRLSPNAPRTPAVELAAVFSGAQVTANNDILAADVTPTAPNSCMRLTVALATGSVLNLTVTDSNSETKTLGLNSSTALGAGDLYFLTWACRDDYTYNLQPETNTEILYLLLDEVVEEQN